MKDIKLKFSTDLKKAIREKNTIKIKVIRTLIAAIDNAGAVAVEEPKVMPMSGGIAGATGGLGSTERARKELSESDVRTIIKNEIGEMEEAVELINDSSRPEAVDLKAQIDILNKYL